METQIFQHHPVIGYTFIPNLKLRIQHEGGGYLLRTNGAGFRSESEFEKEKADGRGRILLFGDSFTAGDGVSNRSRYSDVLESLLPDVEIYNFALPGTGTDQHYLVWQEIAREYEHDLVVIAVQVENIRRIAARHRLSITASGEQMLFPKPYYILLENGEIELNGVPVSKHAMRPEDLPESELEYVDQGGRMLWLRSLVNRMGGPVKDMAQRVSGYQPLPEYDDANRKEWLLLKAILREWTSNISGPVVVMPIPLYHYVEETASPAAYLARFAELRNWPNVCLHDPLPDYHAISKNERRDLRFKTDIHPTPAHHALLAGSLVKIVKQFLAITAEGAASQ